MAAEDSMPSLAHSLPSATGKPDHWLFRYFPPGGPAELWGGLVLIGVSLLGAAWVIKCRSDALALERDGVTVEGKVLRLWVTTGKGSSFYVAYEYPVPPELEAHTFLGETRLDQEQFAKLKEGGPVAVRVCRTDPANHQVLGEPHRVFASIAALAFCLGFLALLALAGVVNLWWWWICRGRPRPGPVFVVSVINVRWRRLKPENQNHEL
jgi:hypothetical protein